MHRFVLLITLALASAAAQDYCSLIVQVVDPNGNPISGVSVALQEATGRVESATAENGEARFCDLGVLGVAVSVGSSSGCQTVVRNLPLDWQLTRRIKMMYDRAPCLVDGPSPVLLCSLLLRFTDGSGRWISGVGFNPGVPRSPNLRSDSYGRAMVRMANREELHVTTAKEGYLPEVIDLQCSSNLGRERIVTLRKSP